MSRSFFVVTGPVRRWAAAAVLVLSTAAGPVRASGDHGHDHGHDHGGAVAAGTASPRMDAHSDLFELVGVLDNGQMTVYLDRYASNEPVTGAKIEFEAGANKGVATPQADGTYLIKFDALGKPGPLAFSFTVTAGADTDLLAAELEIPDSHAHDAQAPARWPMWAGYAAGAAAAALALAFLIARKRKAGPAALNG